MVRRADHADANDGGDEKDDEAPEVATRSFGQMASGRLHLSACDDELLGCEDKGEGSEDDGVEKGDESTG